MSQWVSGFAEEAIGASKVVGDVFGLAFFAVMLGIGSDSLDQKIL